MLGRKIPPPHGPFLLGDCDASIFAPPPAGADPGISGGSRHFVWGGPRGNEVERRRRDDRGAEGAEGDVPLPTGGGV